jgi:radical SAM superfamily enzyme YgiQ (UPF0313 family)
MKKVLFVRTVDTKSEVESRYPGLGLAYLASSLRSHFGEDYFEFKIIERGSEQDVKQQIAAFKPDIAGISSVTQNFNLAKRYAGFIKKMGIPLIMGGVHISMLPQSLPDDVDLACIGEAEETIKEVFDLFIKGKGFTEDELRKIQGIAFRDSNNDLAITAPRSLVEDLDDIRLPARDLLEINRHSYVFSSRGCPFRCTFCASARFWDKVRLFSAEYVVNEIEELYSKYNVKVISFYDDLFIIKPRRLAEITALLEERGLHKKIKFTCSCRASLVNEKIAILLKDMGVVSVGMGLESGSPRILTYLKGETSSVQKNSDAVNILKKHGIAVNASLVIGSPDETESEMMETYDFIKNSSLDLVDIYVLTPYPGTPIWSYAKERGLVSEDMDWSKLNVNFSENYQNSIIVSELYDRKQIWQFYKRFKRLRLYINIKNIWRSPFLIDLPRYILKIVRARISFFVK